jgi:hypothetical protein
LGGEYNFFSNFSFVRHAPYGKGSATQNYFTARRTSLATHDTATTPCQARMPIQAPFLETFVSRRTRLASFSNTTHGSCHHTDDWHDEQGTQACLAHIGIGALRQVRYPRTAKRHFLWGAKRCRAETELLANTLAEALRVPQTKRCVNEEAARETVRRLFAVRNANIVARTVMNTMHACQQ